MDKMKKVVIDFVKAKPVTTACVCAMVVILIILVN